jgi:hypothetical protein
MNNSSLYEITIEGYLPDSCSDWFEGMAVHYDTERKTTSIGHLADQAALIGVLNKLQSLNLIVISVERSMPAN